MSGRATPLTVRGRHLLRIGIALALVLAWVSFGMVRGTLDEARTSRQVAEVLAEPQTLWEIEDLFIREMDQYWNQRHPFRERPFGREPMVGGERIRILVLGDSFTYGVGLYDRSTRLAVLLEQLLAERYGDGAFEVLDVTTPGISFFTHHERVVDMARRRDGGGPLPRPPFDLVIVGSYLNDHTPHPNDRILTDEDLPLLAEWSPAWWKVVNGEAPNPYAAQLQRTSREIVDLVAPAPVLWLPIWTPEGIEDVQWSDIADSGMVRLATPRQDRGLRELSPDVLMAHPLDSHAGPALNLLIAQDVLEAVPAHIPAERIREAQRAPTPPRRALFGAAAPFWLDVTAGAEGRTTVRFDGSRPPWCVDMEFDGRETKKVGTLDGVTGGARAIRCGEDNVQVYETVDVTIPAYTAPCAWLGKPHAMLSVERTRTPERITLTLRSGEDLELWLRTGVLEGAPENRLVGKLRQGAKTRVTLEPGYNALLLARGGSCLDPASALGDFVVEISEPERTWADPSGWGR